MTTATKNPTAHSYSRLHAFTQCPLSYRLLYMDKVGQDDSDAMEIGAAAHEFFDRFVKGGRFYVETEGKTFDAHVTTLAAQCFQKDPGAQGNFKEYLEICQTFAKEYKPDPEYPVVLAELQVAFDRDWKRCDWFSKDTLFRAKIDRIEHAGVPGEVRKEDVKKLRITDYKTGYAAPVDTFQLDIYALVGSLIYPALEEVEVCFYYVKSGFMQKKLLEIKDIGITKIQIEALIERIEGEQKFKAKPGSRCLTCPVARSCDQKPGDLVSIGSLDDAKVLGAEIAFMEAQAKAKKKALNVWCGRNGPVEIGGLVYNHFPTESIHVDMGPFLSACVNFNVDPSDVLNPDSRGIKKATRNAPGFGEAIAPYVGVDVGTRFYSKKADGDGE